MKHTLFVLATLMTLMFTACSSKDNAKGAAVDHLRQSVYFPEKLTIIETSEPDSAFGTDYFTPEEVEYLVTKMKVVTDTIMSRTKDMSTFNPEDYYVLDLADRQMQVSSVLRSIVFHDGKKGAWSGWKVRIIYQALDHNSRPYRCERWAITDQDGKNVVRTIDIPLP